MKAPHWVLPTLVIVASILILAILFGPQIYGDIVVTLACARDIHGCP